MKKKHGRRHNNSSLSVQSDTQELSFLTYQEEMVRLKEKKRQLEEASHRTAEENDQAAHREFTQEQREHLKNAFRYICRLAFKESSRYIAKIRALQSDKQSQPLSDNEFKSKLLGLLKDAEMISGQRYFKEYLENLNGQDQQIIIDYMIWFLENKYLRYLKRTESEKGKRKNMKKELYLRFKNQIMLPYLRNHHLRTTHHSSCSEQFEKPIKD